MKVSLNKLQKLFTSKLIYILAVSFIILFLLFYFYYKQIEGATTLNKNSNNYYDITGSNVIVTNSGEYTIVTYNDSGKFTPKIDIPFAYIVVGGGCGGEQPGNYENIEYIPLSGNGGEVKYSPNLPSPGQDNPIFKTNNDYTITVGNGGMGRYSYDRTSKYSDEGSYGEDALGKVIGKISSIKVPPNAETINRYKKVNKNAPTQTIVTANGGNTRNKVGNDKYSGVNVKYGNIFNKTFAGKGGSLEYKDQNISADKRESIISKDKRYGQQPATGSGGGKAVLECDENLSQSFGTPNTGGGGGALESIDCYKTPKYKDFYSKGGNGGSGVVILIFKTPK